MESTGARNRIHCSQATATLLESAGKSWATRRDDLVHAKGKGELMTYRIKLVKQSNPSRQTGSTLSLNGENSADPDLKRLRNMRWTKAFAATIVFASRSESAPPPLSSNSAEEDTQPSS
jgi:hypothetical protein